MVGDQFGAPTWARGLAEATAIILAKLLERAPCWSLAKWPFSPHRGGQTSWAGFAQAILEDYDALLAWPAETGEFGGHLKAKRVVAITLINTKRRLAGRAIRCFQRSGARRHSGL